MRIAIIGAGPSGLAAALQAAWNGAPVTVFERNASVGRKLLVTGSGHCNITNAAVAAEKYSCADPEWMATLLGCFGVQALLGMLQKVGIPVQKTSDGWYYPLSNSAQTVVDSLSNALVIAGVDLRLSTRATSINAGEKGLTVQSIIDRLTSDTFDRVIVSAGGKAYPTLGSRGELFPVLEQLGHTVLPKRPALAPVLADLGLWKALQGIRLDVGASLWDKQDQVGFTAGNMIFTEWGLNGPAVMDLSHHISARPARELTLSLDLLHFFETEYDELLRQQRKSPVPIRVFLGAFFPPKAAGFLPKMAQIPGETLLAHLDDGALDGLKRKLKAVRLAVKGVRGFEYCQLSAGGVPVSEVNPQTLESRKVHGLYLAGETLDVVGPCGGFNLQFAFGSGALAGLAAAKADQ